MKFRAANYQIQSNFLYFLPVFIAKGKEAFSKKAATKNSVMLVMISTVNVILKQKNSVE